jgi:triphosphatase
MEIEAKYRITRLITADALDELDLAPYTLRTDQDLQHHDLVLDSPERALSNRSCGLRLRQVNGKRILTFKGPNSVNGAVHRHEELEAILPPPGAANDPDDLNRAFDVSDWPAEIAERVRLLIGVGQRLEPLLEIRIHRRTWGVARDGTLIGELALDEGVILAKGNSESVYELELELKEGGQEADLDTLDQLLRLHLPLATQPLSKRERGLALLAQTDDSER